MVLIRNWTVSWDLSGPGFGLDLVYDSIDFVDLGNKRATITDETELVSTVSFPQKNVKIPEFLKIKLILMDL